MRTFPTLLKHFPVINDKLLSDCLLGNSEYLKKAFAFTRLRPKICGKYFLSFPQKNLSLVSLVRVFFREQEKKIPHIPGL